jgi:hypothetical protein
VGANIAYTSARGEFVQKGSNFSAVGVGAWRTSPEYNNKQYLDPVTGMHRAYRLPHPSVASAGISRGYDNPYFIANEAVSTADADRIIGGINLGVTANSWLRFNYTLGVDYSGDNRLQGLPQASSNGPDAYGQVIRANLTAIQWDHNLTATANYNISPNASGSVTLGQNLNSREYNRLGTIGNALIAPTPYTLGNTASQDAPIDYQSTIRMEGYFAQATMDLYQQLYLKGGLRYDGSSTFGNEQMRNWFPSIGAAWQFTNLTGNLNNNLTYGKARASYGEVGTEPAPYLTTVTYVAGGKFTDPYGVAIGASEGGIGGLYTSTVLPAKGLRPERTKELELGTDLGLIRNYADLSFTWYNRRSVDVILDVPRASSSGYTLESANGAELTNKGTEWMLNIRPVTNRNMSLELGFQLGTNRSMVEKLQGVGPGGYLSYGGNGGFGTANVQVGQPVGVFRDYDYVRCGRGVILDDGSPGGYDVDANCGNAPKGALYIDDGTFSSTGLAGFPVPDYSTTRVMGDPNPDWTGSFIPTFRYKKWTFSGLLDIRKGGQVYNGTRYALIHFGTAKETNRRGDDVVFGDTYFKNEKVAGPGAGQTATLSEEFFRYDYGFAVGTGFYEDGSFVKLREISVGYTATEPWVRSIGLSSIDIRVAGRNLHTWTDYKGVDPETNLVGAETGARGIDWFNNPQTRSWIISLTLNR